MMPSNMREQGAHHLIAFCHNDACRHQAIIDGSTAQKAATAATHFAACQQIQR
jgi:hypothetical protein